MEFGYAHLSVLALLKNASLQSAEAITGARQGGTNKKYFEFGPTFPLPRCEFASLNKAPERLCGENNRAQSFE
jgi:hypothetical protein